MQVLRVESSRPEQQALARQYARSALSPRGSLESAPIKKKRRNPAGSEHVEAYAGQWGSGATIGKGTPARSSGTFRARAPRNPVSHALGSIAAPAARPRVQGKESGHMGNVVSSTLNLAVCASNRAQPATDPGRRGRVMRVPCVVKHARKSAGREGLGSMKP